MTIDDLKLAKVAILGFGQEGQAIFNYLNKFGVKPSIYDQAKLETLPEPAQDLIKTQSLNFTGSRMYQLEAVSNNEIIFRSPGVRLTEDTLALAEQKQVQITSQTKWFFDQCPAQIIGVTGTKGKGTTASLIYEILKTSKSQAGHIYLTGNIGKVQSLEFLDNLTTQDIVIYELSSFQLMDLDKSPHIGVCLMTTTDHLDFHKDVAEYQTAKEAICKFQSSDDHIIFNIDYDGSKIIGQGRSGQKWEVSKNLTVEHGANILDEKVTIKGLGDELIIDTSKRLLRGLHNMENIAAASVVASIIGVEQQTIEQAIANFRGLEHRLEFVANKNGVNFYNDSISTNPDTTIAAINSFNEPIIVLIGGASKQLDNQKLISALLLKPNIKTVVCIGEVGKQIYESLKDVGFNGLMLGVFDNFTEAVNEAIRNSEKGDVVLLSPAATSYDMFHNYKERGELFKKLVENI